MTFAQVEEVRQVVNVDLSTDPPAGRPNCDYSSTV